MAPDDKGATDGDSAPGMPYVWDDICV
jgi:hypothetical protein